MAPADSEPDEDAVTLFIQALGVGRDVAVALAAAGHTSLEEVAYVPFAELCETGLPESVLRTLRDRARSLLMDDR